MDPDETGVRPALGERGQRDPDQVRAVGGVQPGVVALRLHPAHRRAGQHPGGAGQFDRDGRLVLACRGAPTTGAAARSRRRTRRSDSASRSAGPACGRSRPRPGRTRPRRGRRTRSRTRSPAAGRTGRSTRASSMPSRPGIRMSRKTASTSVSRSTRSASVASPAVYTRPPAGRRAAGRPARPARAARRRRPAPAGRSATAACTLTVATLGATPHRSRTPGWNFGTRMLTFVPAPGAVSTTRPNCRRTPTAAVRPRWTARRAGRRRRRPSPSAAVAAPPDPCRPRRPRP